MDTLLLLYSGRPLAVPEIAGKANALLEAWMPGTEGNRAVRDILTGHRSPSGRLTMSFPYSTGQCPVYYNRYSYWTASQRPISFGQIYFQVHRWPQRTLLSVWTWPDLYGIRIWQCGTFFRHDAPGGKDICPMYSTQYRRKGKLYIEYL